VNLSRKAIFLNGEIDSFVGSAAILCYMAISPDDCGPSVLTLT